VKKFSTISTTKKRSIRKSKFHCRLREQKVDRVNNRDYIRNYIRNYIIRNYIRNQQHGVLIHIYVLPPAWRTAAASGSAAEIT